MSRTRCVLPVQRSASCQCFPTAATGVRMMTDLAATATNHRQNVLGLMAVLIAHVSLFGWVIACRFLCGRATPGGYMPIPRAYMSSL